MERRRGKRLLLLLLRRQNYTRFGRFGLRKTVCHSGGTRTRILRPLDFHHDLPMSDFDHKTTAFFILYGRLLIVEHVETSPPVPGPFELVLTLSDMPHSPMNGSGPVSHY